MTEPERLIWTAAFAGALDPRGNPEAAPDWKYAVESAHCAVEAFRQVATKGPRGNSQAVAMLREVRESEDSYTIEKTHVAAGDLEPGNIERQPMTLAELGEAMDAAIRYTEGEMTAHEFRDHMPEIARGLVMLSSLVQDYIEAQPNQAQREHAYKALFRAVAR